MEKDTLQHSQELLRSIREEGMSALESVYQDYRNDFLRFALKYGLTEVECLDVYQDAIIALYENVQEGKLTKLTSSLKTYLFSIGKYILLNQLKAKQKIVPESARAYDTELVEVPPFESIELDERQEQIQKALNNLGGQCRELITLFYYHRYSIRQIQVEMEYSNENTVKAAKSRCMKKLKGLMGQ